LQQAMRECDVVHNHSLWMLPNHYSSAAAHACGKPVVIAPHGTLEPDALRISRWKKRAVGAWFQNQDLRRAACLHLITPAEVAGVRAYGLTNPVAFIPNGVDIPPVSPELRSRFFQRYPHLAGRRICLFLSRLHQKKGLPHLIQAWRKIIPAHADWHLLIAGPDCGMEATIRRMVSEFELGQSVTLAGALLAQRKLEALSAAGLFVLPSFTEGFSMAVLEAMAAGVPVLVTPGCNFGEIAAQHVGVIVDPTARDVERGLRELLALSDSERAQMGAHGHALVESHYTWDLAAQKLADLYAWLYGGGPAPPFVEFA
jgi:glycosyltransferase involved in cell wall biosynthesis